MDWQSILWEIIRIAGVLLDFAYQMIVTSYTYVAEQAGTAAGFLFLIIMFVAIPFLVGFFSISRVQQRLESVQAWSAKLFIKLIAIGLLTFTMMYLIATASV